MSRRYNVIDADGHVLEPFTLWDDYLDPQYREIVESKAKKPDTEIQNTEGNDAGTTANSSDSGPGGGPPVRRSGVSWMLGGSGLSFRGGKDMDMQTKVKLTALESINQILWLPAQILVFSFTAIIIALLITALFIFIFYPSPILFGKCLTITTSG